MLKTGRSRRLFKEGSWIVFGQVLMVVGSLAGVRLLTELLPPDAYGELALGMTVATLVNQIILGPLGGGIIRFYAPAVEHGDLAGYLQAVKKLVLRATALIFLITVFAIAGLMVAGEMQWVAITASALAFAILSGYSANLAGIQMAARQRSIVAIHQGVEPLLRSLVAAGLILLLGMGSTVAMVGYMIAALLILGSQIYFFQNIIRGSTFGENKRNWQDEIWKFSWPIGIFGVFTWLQLASDRWALQVFSTIGDVGSYAVLYQLGYYPISLLTGMAMQFLVPILYQRAGDARDSKRNAGVNGLSWKLTWLSLGVTGVAFLGALLLHRQIFWILVAEKYRSVSYLLPWIVISGGVFASGQALASNLQAQMKTREMMAAKIITALLGIAINFIGAYWYGITGVICAGLVFSILYFAWMVILVNKGGEKECFC
ncbi:MAG: lipopolysaccharide biosynthesis protein [Gallionellaceae bacterium]|nr:MAG: lipopolysaccharide biosynthesis protein [Gallionellaceae bacterium]